MEGIDMAVGLEYAGEDEELYREILADYMECAKEQTEAIERAAAEEDHEAYTIEVHSLKSTSRTIGALELSNMARKLEQSSRNQEWETVRAGTPALLAAYRQICLAIKPNNNKRDNNNHTYYKKNYKNNDQQGNNKNQN